MTEKKLDLSGKVCPYCLLAVQKESKNLSKGDTLVITCDHPPAVRDSIPQYCQDNGMSVTTKMIGPGIWELRCART
jgi:TusA-related sulfurtransferase